MYVTAFYSFREVKWKNCDYIDMMRMTWASCRKMGLDFWCISDGPQADLPTFITDLPRNLMQATTKGQLDFIDKHRDKMILHTGADCLVYKDPRNECPPEYDIAITCPRMSEAINTGAIWVRNHEKCLPVWQDALAALPEKWGDDQRVLWTALVKHERDGLKILKHNTETHNRPATLDDPAAPFVVHYKGQRKDQMRPFFLKHIA